MRAALSILGLVIAFAIVLTVMKKQAAPLRAQVPAASAPAADGASAVAMPTPQAVGADVQGAIDAAAARASAAAAD